MSSKSGKKFNTHRLLLNTKGHTKTINSKNQLRCGMRI